MVCMDEKETKEIEDYIAGKETVEGLPKYVKKHSFFLDYLVGGYFFAWCRQGDSPEGKEKRFRLMNLFSSFIFLMIIIVPVALALWNHFFP